MNLNKKIGVIVISLSLLISLACMWDRDTVEMEKQDFPEVIDLISGNFLRHSKEYYQWRVQDRKNKLKLYPDSLALYDDLAVAYSKLEQNKNAIEIILRKGKIKPGLYETYANLGTFYLHDHQFEKGIKYIDKAIKINPNAHFGREVYQKYAAEYILSKQVNGKIKLPLNDQTEYSARKNNFYYFILNKSAIPKDSLWNEKYYKLKFEETQRAVAGIKGMMKFGNYDSPILLELLTDLLENDQNEQAAKQLAARALIKASYAVKDTAVQKKYLSRAMDILMFQETNEMGDGNFKNKVGIIEKYLLKEIKAGEAFFNQIRKDEMAWIKANKDVDKEFELKYYIPNRIEETKVLKNTNDSLMVLKTNKTFTKNEIVSENKDETYRLYALILVGIALTFGIFGLYLRKNKKK